MKMKILGNSRYRIIICLWVFFLSHFHSSPVVAVSQEEQYPWPKPISTVWGDAVSIPLSPTFKIVSPKHRNLQSSVYRYNRIIYSEHWFPILSSTSYNTIESSTISSLEKLNVFVRDLQVELQHGVDESYILTVPASGDANLSAKTPWGAMRGLETFSQLVRRYNATSVYPLVFQRQVKIVDYPLYPHRGLLLDTARNFIPLGDILRTIRAMSYNKLNVFHWHITDSQSFPLDLNSEPTLAIKGSYSPEMRYSSNDVKRIVNYGRNHGVRVVPEIDTPGLYCKDGAHFKKDFMHYKETIRRSQHIFTSTRGRAVDCSKFQQDRSSKAEGSAFEGNHIS